MASHNMFFHRILFARQRQNDRLPRYLDASRSLVAMRTNCLCSEGHGHVFVSGYVSLFFLFFSMLFMVSFCSFVCSSLKAPCLLIRILTWRVSSWQDVAPQLSFLAGVTEPVRFGRPSQRSNPSKAQYLGET